MGKRAGRLNLQAGTESLTGEILVAGDIDELELVRGSGIDSVDDTKYVGGSFLLKVHAGIEQAAGLEVVEKIALPFIEQVVVDGIFFVDGDFLFQYAVADMKAQRVKHHDGTGIDEIGVIDGVRRRVVGLPRDGNLSQDPLLFLEFLAQALQRIGNTGCSNSVAGMHPGDLLKLDQGENGVARKLDFADVSWLTCADVKQDIHLLRGGIGGAFGGDARTIITIFLHELANVLQGAAEFFGRVEFAELELGGIEDLVSVGVARRTFHFDGSDKKVERGGEGEQHIRSGGNSFRLNVGKSSRGEKDADAFADLITAEGLAGFLGEHLQQVVAVGDAGKIDGADVTSGVG